MGFETKPPYKRGDSRFKLLSTKKKKITTQKPKKPKWMYTKRKPFPKAEMKIRKARLKQLGFENYREYLNSPLWAKNKEKIRPKGLNRKCSKCGKRTNFLQPHHKTYVNLGRETKKDVSWLCGPCHRDEHFH